MKRSASFKDDSSQPAWKKQRREEKEAELPPVLLPRIAHELPLWSMEDIRAQPQAFVQSFQEHGLAVVRSMYSSEVCEQAKTKLLQTIQASYEEAKNEDAASIRIDQPEDWPNRAFPQNFSVGILKECVGLTSSEGMRQVTVHDDFVYCQRLLWQVDEQTPMLTSFDTCRIVRCEHNTDKVTPNLGWYHIDQNPAHRHLQHVLYGERWERACIQSQIVLSDQSAPLSTGSFSYLPRSHQTIRRLLQTQGVSKAMQTILGDDKKDFSMCADPYLRLQPQSLFYQARNPPHVRYSSKFQPLASSSSSADATHELEPQQPCILSVPQGSVIFWASDLVHANWPGAHPDWKKKTALPAAFREAPVLTQGYKSVVCFVSMMPKPLVEQIMQPIFATRLPKSIKKELPKTFAEFLEQRRRFYQEGKTSKTHWIPALPILDETQKVCKIFHTLQRVTPCQKRARIHFVIPRSSILSDLTHVAYGPAMQAFLP